jgi:hypothetical protein
LNDLQSAGFKRDYSIDGALGQNEAALFNLLCAAMEKHIAGAKIDAWGEIIRLSPATAGELEGVRVLSKQKLDRVQAIGLYDFCVL